MADNIKAPSHYVDGRKYEPKDVIRDWGLNFNLGSAVKYISRAGRKGDMLEDLQKAKQFLEFEIEAVEEENDGASRELFYKSLEAIDEYSKKVLKEEDEKRISAELLSRAVTRSENPMKFEDVPESLKPFVIITVGNEVLDGMCDLEGNITSDELRKEIINYIIENLDNGKLNFFELPESLFEYSPEIIEWADNLINKGKEYEKIQGDIGMTCKEAAAIGDAIAKGFEEGIQQNDNDLSLADIIGMIMKHNDIPEPDVIKLHFKFEDDPTAIPANTVSIKFHTNRKEI